MVFFFNKKEPKIEAKVAANPSPILVPGYLSKGTIMLDDTNANRTPRNKVAIKISPNCTRLGIIVLRVKGNIPIPLFVTGKCLMQQRIKIPKIEAIANSTYATSEFHLLQNRKNFIAKEPAG